MPAPRARPIPIIDTHIHLFDPTRPQGAPYSGPRAAGAAPIAAYPDRYRKLAMPLGSVGAIKVEASPWVEDNLWVLEVAQRDTIIVGVIGNLEPDKPEFKEYFDRYRKHPLFRGIRYGNLWGRDIAQAGRQPGVHRRPETAGRCRSRARHGQSADGAARVDAQNQRQGPRACASCSTICPTSSPRPRSARRMPPRSKSSPNGRRSTSSCPRSSARSTDEVSTDVNSYRDKLDLLVATFGDDRILFGSDWPNSDGVAPVDQVFSDREGSTSRRSRARSRRNTSGETRSPPTSG